MVGNGRFCILLIKPCFEFMILVSLLKTMCPVSTSGAVLPVRTTSSEDSDAVMPVGAAVDYVDRQTL